MMFKLFNGKLGAIAALSLGTLTMAATADTPVLSGSYGWEDGIEDILGSFGNLFDPMNVTAPEPVFDGNHALRFTREVGVPQAYVAYIEHLEHGDVIEVSLWVYDDGVTTGRSRLWAHYANSGDVNSFRGSPGLGSPISSGGGWQQMTYEWVFDADENNPSGPRDAFVIEVRGYAQSGSSSDPKTGPTDHYADDITVNVYCAANPDLTITFPGASFDGPARPGPECDPGKPCTPSPLGNFGWEDEISTVFNTTGNITTFENTGEFNGVSPAVGDRMLRLQTGSTSGTPQAWVAFIENLQDGDEVNASMFAFDDQPGGNPRIRMWGHGAISGDPGSVVGQYGGQNGDYTSGIGWEELNDTWVFDSQGGQRDALMIHVRLYAAEEDTDFFVDEIFVEVCTDNPNVTVTFPGDLEPPAEPCDLPNGTPSVDGNFGWEDATSTILGYDNDDDKNITAANVDSPVNSGKRALRVTEGPHVGTPKIFMAYIEHLEDGDVIHGRFHTFDDTPGAPEVRIWGRRVFSGDINSFALSAGGNDVPSSGDGWEELCNTWVFDSGDANRDALVIEARVYSTPATCEECSTDFYFDDMYVAVYGNSNATITFPDGVVIGEPPLLCPSDLDGNGEVNSLDLFILLGSWGTSDPNADINNDGVVDGADLGILLGQWGACAVPYLRPAAGDINLVVESSDAGGGLIEHRILVDLDEADDAVVNVYDANVTFSGGYDTSSFIAIGTQDLSVVVDPNFDDFGFAFGFGLGDDAGWYNDNPANNLGRAGNYPNNRVLIASFTMDKGENATGELSVTYNNAEGRAIYGTATFDTAAVPPSCTGDLNGDGVVNVSDLLILLGAWGSCPGCPEDLNGDGVVNVSDLLILLGNWGSCD